MSAPMPPDATTPRRAAAGLALTCCCFFALSFAAAPSHAEDEDTSASVYLVFDPETGEFVTQDDPNAALPHQTGLESNAAPPAHAAADGAEASSGSARAMIAVGTIATVAIGGLLFRLKKKRQAAART